MKTFKDIVRSVAISIMMSMTIFGIVGVVYDQIGKGSFVLEGYGFTKMILACVATGLGFGVPSVLYQVEKLPTAQAAVIHLGIGLTIYFFAAMQVGWIPVRAGTLACICTVAGMILIAILLWLGFLKYYQNLAARMNHELQSRNS